MSDKPISVGDLVAVVRPTSCCGGVRALGMTRQVTEIATFNAHCRKCGTVQHTPCAMLGNSDDPQLPWTIPLHRLKRIPPLSELEGVRTEETLKEPA